MKELLELYITFFKIGAFTVGGGYAMLPLIEKEFVERRGWATSEEITNYYAIGQCTPGVIIINTVTFLGYKRRGIAGAIFSTAGVVTPSVICIGIIASFISNFTDLAIVQHAFSGIRVCVTVLIISTVFKFIKGTVKNVYSALLFLASLLISLILDPSPVLIIVIAAIIGFFFPCGGGEGE